MDPRSRKAVSAAVGAAICLCLLWLPQRPPVVPQAPISANDLGILLQLAQTQFVDAPNATLAKYAACVARIVPRDRATPDQQTSPNYAFALTNQLDDPRCHAWFDTLAAEIRLRDRWLEPVRPGGELPARTPWQSAFLALAATLMGAVAALALWLIAELPSPLRRQFCAIFLGAFALRALVPHRLVSVYFGYEYFAQAVYLDSLPRYGPASTALWGQLLGTVLRDHAWILWLQACMGALTVAFWSIWLTLARQSQRAGWLFGLIFAASPVILRDHVSESLHVGALLALAVACVAGLRQQVWLAALSLALSGLFRFDVTILALLTWLLLAYIARTPVRNWRAPAMVFGAITAWVIHAAWLRMLDDSTAGNLEQLPVLLRHLPELLVKQNALLRADWVPIGLWLSALIWLALGKARETITHRWLLLVPLAVLWLLPYYADFNPTSLPRLQMPAITCFMLCAAALMDQLGQMPRGNVWLSACLIAWLVSATPTLSTSFRLTNAHIEDDLLREARASLPKDAAFVLVTRTYAETPSADLHLHLPTYLFGLPGGNGLVVSASAYLAARDRGQHPLLPTYFLRSVRCYASTKGQVHTQEHAACTRLAALKGTTTIFERDQANFGDEATFDYYGNVKQLRVGLYKLP